VQPNSVVSWGNGVTPTATTAGQYTVSTPNKSATVNIDDLKGSHAQAGRLTEWLKLALDQPELLETLGATANLGVLVSGPAGVGKSALVRAVCADRRLVELDGPEVGALRAEDRLRASRRRWPPCATAGRAAHHRYRRCCRRPPIRWR
jgi:transitional endoplasmic reticulum ATPase